jgi:hypothetical protein
MARGSDTTVDDMADVADDATADDVETSSDDSTSDAPVDFQEAFRLAKDQHSKAAADEHARGTEASTDDDEETETPPARKGKAEPVPAKAAATKTADPTGLLTDEEFSQLQTKHADDPAALRKALEGVFTKKTQALADQRKSSERLSQYVDIIDAYEEDPEATVVALGKALGLTVSREGEARAETKATETAATTADAIIGEFKESLGPELEYLADGLAPAITKLVERLTKSAVEQETQPIKEQTRGLLGKAAVEATEAVMKTFGEKHPDWEQHEPAMLELSQKLSPKGMTEIEYLTHLYTIVTAETPEARDKAIDAKAAAKAKATIEKMKRGAETTETRADATPEREVRGRRPDLPSFEDAYAAAKRGERWE